MFQDFFQSSSPADYAKDLINIKNADENNGIVEETKDRILDLEDKIEQMNEKNNNKNVKETLEIIRKILDYNKNAQDFFHRASKVDKRKSEAKTEESIAETIKSKNNKIVEIKKEEKNINNLLFKHHFIDYQNPSDMYKKLCETKDKENEDQVYSIKKILDKIRKEIKNVPKNKTFILKQRIINIVERILYFNQLEQEGLSLEILTPNQMLSRFPITLAQLKAGNNSEKLKNEIRQLLYFVQIKKTYKTTI